MEWEDGSKRGGREDKTGLSPYTSMCDVKDTRQELDFVCLHHWCMCADSRLILDVDDVIRKIDDGSQPKEKVNEKSMEESQPEHRKGGGLRVESGVIESKECRDEGNEEGGVGVESGGMENEECREEGHKEEIWDVEEWEFKVVEASLKKKTS